ncbi:MAG: HD domain-containing protein [Candidatus Nitrosocosmicus sp.]
MNEVEKISKAFGLALRIHNNMTRKYQYDKIEPQINHSLRVALIVNEEMSVDDSDLVCSALLHDISIKQEISKETKEYIKNELSEKTLDVISFFNKYSNQEQSNKNEEQKIERQFSRVKQSDTLIKNILLAERLDELRSLKNSRRRDKITRMKEETQKYFIPLAETTNEKILLKLVIALYELK